tara:strand:- start:47 stop:253 length:207 start_codon:yes stop_codon:yes gene_type:complete
MDIDSVRLIIQKLEAGFGLAKEDELKTEPLVTEESIQTLESIVTDLMHMKNSHHKYLVRWLKQGYLSD